jgi:hypothetical protein
MWLPSRIARFTKSIEWLCQFDDAGYIREMDQLAEFNCPNLDAAYKVVRAEAPTLFNDQITCLSCGGPLQNLSGQFALKYFRTDGRRDVQIRPNGPRPKLI